MARELWGHDNLLAIECEATEPQDALREASRLLEDNSNYLPISATLAFQQLVDESKADLEGNGWTVTLVVDVDN